MNQFDMIDNIIAFVLAMGVIGAFMLPLMGIYELIEWYQKRNPKFEAKVNKFIDYLFKE